MDKKSWLALFAMSAVVGLGTSYGIRKLMDHKGSKVYNLDERSKEMLAISADMDPCADNKEQNIDFWRLIVDEFF